MKLALKPQNHEPHRWAHLPDAEKERLETLLGVMMLAARADNPLTILKQESARLKHLRGFSEKSLQRNWYKLKEHGDWTCLIRECVDPESVALPKEVIELFRMYCERNQRGKARTAWRRMIAALRAGEHFEGIGTWRDLWEQDHPHRVPPEQCPSEYVPRGWSYKNLVKHRPTKFEQTAVNIGRSAATKFRPTVNTTRVGSYVGQGYVLDDVHHDNKVNLLGVNSAALRPLELAVMDFTSACKFHYGFKAMREDLDTKKKKMLVAQDMLFFMCSILSEFGYNPRGTTFFVEHGTAAISRELEAKLHDWSDGAITVDRSGIHRDPAIAGLFEARSKGNPNFKAVVESSFNLTHNELAHLPGQMGLSRDRSPEELYGRDAHNRNLIKAMMALPPERAKLLRLPFLEFNRFTGIADEVYKTINWRTWHDLEGWVESGFVKGQFRFSEGLDWLDEDEYFKIPEKDRAAVDAVIQRAENNRTRKLSPMEVWRQGRGQLVKPAGWWVPMILGDLGRREETVGKDHLFTFQDKSITPDVLMYEAEVHTMKNRVEPLKPGESYVVHVNPFDLSAIYLSKNGTDKGAFLGYCKRWTRAPKFDHEAVVKKVGATMKKEKQLLAPVARRGSGITKARQEDADWNANVIGGSEVKKLEKSHASQVEKVNVVAELLNEEHEEETPDND